MLSANAHSFRLKSRLAISLSWIAGFTNAVTLISFAQVVSHQTGNSTHVALAIGRLILGQSGAAGDVIDFSFLLASFLAGAMYSGIMTEGARRAGWKSQYTLPMAVEAFLLLIFTVLLHHRSLQNPSEHSKLWYSIGIAAFAMGLQNATITRISGAVVRTTHLTGVITDFGLESIHLLLWWADRIKRAPSRPPSLRIRHVHPSANRLILLASIFFSFLFGAILGTITFTRFGSFALLAPITWIALLVATTQKSGQHAAGTSQ
jgi:uncharacterized membrane protein YoaK (UPF0700 family)